MNPEPNISYYYHKNKLSICVIFPSFCCHSKFKKGMFPVVEQRIQDYISYEQSFLRYEINAFLHNSSGLEVRFLCPPPRQEPWTFDCHDSKFSDVNGFVTDLPPRTVDYETYTVEETHFDIRPVKACISEPDLKFWSEKLIKERSDLMLTTIPRIIRSF